MSSPIPDRAARPEVTISIVNTNNRDLLQNCLRSIFETTRVQVEAIVVDNASTDGSAAMVQREFPQVAVLQNETRAGFAASHNRALERGAGRYLFVLNEDTQLLSQCLDTLIAFMDAHPDAGACGPRLWNGDGSLQRTANRFPTLWFGIFEALSLNRLFPQNPARRHNTYADWDRATTREVDSISGAALLVRREAMEQVGLLDPHFFIYSEEVDWCLRLHQRGWKIFYVADAQLIHYGGSSTTARAPEKFHQIHWDSFLYYYRKHFGAPAYWLVRVLFETRMAAHRLKNTLRRVNVLV
jgi:hypothetical protein